MQSRDNAVVDDIALPLENPWRRNVRLADIAFFKDGTAAGVETDGDARAPYTIEPPQVLADPNPIDGIVRAAAKGNASLAGSPVDATLAAYAAHAEQLDDVASALIAPLVEPQDAAAVALQMASAFVGEDPAYPQGAASPGLAREGARTRPAAVASPPDGDAR